MKIPNFAEQFILHKEPMHAKEISQRLGVTRSNGMKKEIPIS